MDRIQISPFFLALLAGACASAAAQAALPVAYKATLLHPLSGFATSEANSVDGDWQVGTGWSPSPNSDPRALLWNGSAESVIDLTPPGADASGAGDVEGSIQVGSARFGGVDGSYHAMLWNGTPESAVDLHPLGFAHSGIGAVSGGVQVGAGYVGAFSAARALMWHGTADSVVNLHPASFAETWAVDVDSSTNSQVGTGNVFDPEISSRSMALLWHGSAASLVNLHPAAFAHSVAYAVSGNDQVGYGQLSPYGGPTHALLWHGAAEDYVNLHPAGFNYSYATGISGELQVGAGALDGFLYRALVWNGTAASVVNLHSSLADLPIEFAHSIADEVDSQGNIVGHGLDSAGRSYALLWTPIPEPSSGTLMLLAGVTIQAATCRRPSAKLLL